MFVIVEFWSHSYWFGYVRIPHRKSPEKVFQIQPGSFRMAAQNSTHYTICFDTSHQIHFILLIPGSIPMSPSILNKWITTSLIFLSEPLFSFSWFLCFYHQSSLEYKVKDSNILFHFKEQNLIIYYDLLL